MVARLNVDGMGSGSWGCVGCGNRREGGTYMVQRTSMPAEQKSCSVSQILSAARLSRPGGCHRCKRGMVRTSHKTVSTHPQTKKQKRTGGGLVAEENLRVGHHAAHQRQPALLPTAQAPDHDPAGEPAPDPGFLLALQPREADQGLGLANLPRVGYRGIETHVRLEEDGLEHGDGRVEGVLFMCVLGGYWLRVVFRRTRDGRWTMPPIKRQTTSTAIAIAAAAHLLRDVGTKLLEGLGRECLPVVGDRAPEAAHRLALRQDVKQRRLARAAGACFSRAMRAWVNTSSYRHVHLSSAASCEPKNRRPSILS